MPHLSPATSPEPLVRSVDLAQYTEGLARYRAGGWDDEQWTAFRVRFGIYGQKQPGVQMVRIKIPGGMVPVAWLRVIAEANRRFAEGKAHVTTRQDVQIYYVATDRTADLMAFLNENGVTTREACGNTIRNLTSCALSGVCPREHVDAGKVASDLARLWLRHPLTQHMPRKFKIAVSGCETDCGATGLHDMGLVATERDGLKGFRVVAAGGLGGTPRPAVVVADFATAAEIPAILEALLRLHQRYSDRRNRNASRIKFLVNRFGEDKFLTLFAEELERIKGLPGRPFAEPSWRAPSAAPEPGTPGGVVAQHDGLSAIVIDLPLGCISSDEMDALAGIAERAGVAELRATREQSLVVVGVQPAEAARVTAEIRALGLKVADAEGELPDVISCPGTTTCRIGITSSYNFAAEVLAQAETDPRAKLVNVRVSGCQNSCGLHHVADFGFHGMAKKIDGKTAPHYQIHLGGNSRALDGMVALSGPIVPARLGTRALKLLRDGYLDGRLEGESVRAWAERQGKAGLATLLKPISEAEAGGEMFVDWGDAADFAGAPQTKGECAAPFAVGDLYEDLADDALISMDRALLAGWKDRALAFAGEAVGYAARPLVMKRGGNAGDEMGAAQVVEALLALWADNAGITGQLTNIAAERGKAEASGELHALREAVALWLDTARALAAAPEAAEPSLDDLQSLVNGL